MTLKRTAFHDRAAALGASFGEYAGYEFPSSYAKDILDEYWACRQRAVIMDLTPLRKVEVTGSGARAVLQRAVTRDLNRLRDGDVVYSAICDDDGNVVDDGTVFRFAPDRFRWVGYTDEDEDWLRGIAERSGLDVDFENSTDRLHNVAVQGPESREIMKSVFVPASGRRPLEELTWFTFSEGTLGEGGPAVLVSRTGYSGELGYEVWCRPQDGGAVWDAVWGAGESRGLAPLGLDALDIVRVEAGLIFKGYEYSGTEDPFEAGIGFTVAKNKQDDYVGKKALEDRRRNPSRVLVGLEVGTEEPVVSGDRVVASGGGESGTVTSGVRSPILKSSIALARVPIASAEVGTALTLERSDDGATVRAKVVAFPFYDPEKKRPRS
jgi:aminomethyltransferase